MLFQMGFILLISFFIYQSAEAVSRIDPLVHTSVGLIRGLRALNGEYSMFLGIPYATVDTANPFGPATPHPGFAAAFEAYDDSVICPQIDEVNYTIAGSLDCLHLNIYVPNSATFSNRLPVLVWIHGGGFAAGDSNRYLYGPSYLIRHGVILVSINYRLGPYGFMCLDTPLVPGNQGLKDQRLALRWIKDNIGSFGGDVQQITIFGESAGSASVDLHLYYDQENLFNRVIMQSGHALGFWAVMARDEEAPFKLASYFGFITEDINEALSFLSSVDASLIIAASSELNLKFTPCVEQDYGDVDTFITEHPININVSRAANIPILIGYNDHEWLGKHINKNPEYFDNYNIYHDNLVHAFTFDDQELEEMVEIVRHFYNGDEALDVNGILNLIDFDSDFYFHHPTERSIQKYLGSGANNIYFYVFSYVGGRNYFKHRDNITIGGAAHQDEIGYLFDVSYMTEIPSPEDQLIIDRITMLWTNFVKSGNPTPETSELLPILWTPVTEDVRYYLKIDTDMTMERRPFKERMSFWDLFYWLNYNYQYGYKENFTLK